MTINTVQYEPHCGSQSFTTATYEDKSVQVREWDIVTTSIAEVVTEVEIPRTEYQELVAAHNGNERAAREEVIRHARQRVERRVTNRLAHDILPKLFPEPVTASPPHPRHRQHKSHLRRLRGLRPLH